MKKNKKKTELFATDTFSLDDLNTMQPSPQKEEHNNNVLIAKVAVVVIALFIVTLCVLKLIAYLEKPKNTFFQIFDNARKDIEDLMESLESDELYKSIYKDSNSIDYEMNVEVKSLEGEYRGLENIINMLNFTGKMETDNRGKYIKNDLLASHDENELFQVSYLKDEKEKIYNIPKLSNSWYKSADEKELIDLSYYLSIMSTLKSPLYEIVKNERFSTDREDLNINSKKISCLKSYIDVRGEYLATYLDDIDSSYNYTFISYNDITTGEFVRFEVNEHYKDDQTVNYKIVYTRSTAYWQFETSSKSLTIIGQPDQSVQITLREKEDIYNFTKNTTPEETNYTIKISSAVSSGTSLDINLSSVVDHASKNGRDIDITADVEDARLGEKQAYKVIIKAHVNKSETIFKEDISALDKIVLDDTTKNSMRHEFVTLLKNIDFTNDEMNNTTE